MKRLLLVVVALLAVGGLVLAYLKTSRERTQDAEADKAIAAPSRLEHLPDGRPAIKLDPDTQARIALATAPATSATLDPERRAYGQVLDPARLEAQVTALASGQAALAASSREYERLKTLYTEHDNASARALEAAEAATKRDRLAVEEVRLQLATEWGKALPAETNLLAFARSLATLQAVLVRLDLPTGEALLESPTGAQLVVPGIPHPLPARLLGRAPTTNPQVQGTGFLFALTNAPPSLTPGLAVSGLLQLPGKPLDGVIVPNAAVVRSSGHTWVYVQVNDITFARREISVDHPVPGGWFVTDGITAHDRVVTTGAETLLSEELRTQIKLPD
jgi:multidrug efflux pump subunit AcrA (membrane-fusion protein)